MRAGELGWAICLAGLPWSYFLLRLLTPFNQLDIWHANAWWMQTSGFLLAGLFASEGKRLGRIPSAWWWLVSWVSLLMLWRFTSLMRPGQAYLTAMLTGVANLWLVLLLALLLTACSEESLERIGQAIFWSGVGLSVYGLLQAANLDQFFHWIDDSKTTDTLAGVIGNPTHFGCQMALWLPFGLMQPFPRRLWALPALLVIALSQSTTACSLAALLLVAFAWSRSWKIGGLALLVSLGLGVMVLWMSADWLNPTGRVEVWAHWWQVLHAHPILGDGLGFVKNVADQLPVEHPLKLWKHLHNEYLQWWVETGAVGLGLLGWGLWQLWRRRMSGMLSPFRWACRWSLIAFGLLSLVSFPWHLWQLGGWGLFSFCGWLVNTEPI